MSSRESSPTVLDSPPLASTDPPATAESTTTAQPLATAPEPEPPPGEPRGRRALRYLKYAAFAALGLAVAGMLIVFFVIRHYEKQLPDVDQLKHSYDPPQVTRILARDGTLLASLYTERRTVIPFEEIPRHAKLAFLAAEDASFYEHEGLDYFGMLRALVANLRAGRTRQGASTITQQVVKNVLLDPERTYKRKIKETILARRLEQSLSKDEIFSLYLNHLYLGHGRYGIEEASRYYFGKKARDLDLPEAALLAGIVAAPERFSPRASKERALTRRRYVLGQMLEKGFVTKELFDRSIDAPLYLEPASDGESDLIPEVVGHVKRLLEEVAGERAKKGGYTVELTIDPALQAAARKAVRENLDAFAKRHDLLPPFTVPSRKSWPPPMSGTPKPYKAYTARVTHADDAAGTLTLEIGSERCRILLANEERYNPQKLKPSEFAKVGAALRASLVDRGENGAAGTCRLELGPESALVTLDVRTREVLALIGSYEALPGGLDRAIQARRQPGSAFKPMLYSYALHSRRFTPASVLELPEKQAGRKPGEPAKDGATRKLSLRLAVAQSDNDAAVKVLEEVGAPNVVSWAHAVGIESALEPTPSLALGAYEVTPLELTAAYATFASGGEYDAPRLVRSIRAPDGREIPLPARPPRRRVMTPEEAYLTTSLLRSVVQQGTAKRAQSLGRPIAGKTGTTNQAKDAWFVGYSTDFVTGVWVGFDDPQPLGSGESGAVTALPAFIALMKVAHEKRPATEFPRPGSIVTVSIDPTTGLLAREGQSEGVEEEFLDGTAPSEIAPEIVEVPDGGLPDGGTDEDVASQGTGSLPEVPEVPLVPVSGDDAGEPAPPF
jgi:penicillin-binding protein 1A